MAHLMTYYFHVFNILHTVNNEREETMKIAKKKKEKFTQSDYMSIFAACTTHVYGSRCYNLFVYQICKSLFVYYYFFLPFDVQPQVIFPFEHCAIDAQHVVTAWRYTLKIHFSEPHTFYQWNFMRRQNFYFFFENI